MRNSNRPNCSTWYTTTGGQMWARLMAEVGRKQWHERERDTREDRGKKASGENAKWSSKQKKPFGH